MSFNFEALKENDDKPGVGIGAASASYIFRRMAMNASKYSVTSTLEMIRANLDDKYTIGVATLCDLIDDWNDRQVSKTS